MWIPCYPQRRKQLLKVTFTATFTVEFDISLYLAAVKLGTPTITPSSSIKNIDEAIKIDEGTDDINVSIPAHTLP